MKLAVLSDIHSNRYALEAVIADVAAESPDRVVILGDFFGYYPWAVETYHLVRELRAVCLRGNHDELLLQVPQRDVQPPHVLAAQDNARRLRHATPQSLEWLADLPFVRTWVADTCRVQICHGTPADPASGRYYPDDARQYDWFPRGGQVLLLGHTHYPLLRRTDSGGLIGNPGSVGQPRDGDVRASWALLDTRVLSFEIHRTTYNVERATTELKTLDWDRSAIAALAKDYTGPLRIVKSLSEANRVPSSTRHPTEI